MSNIVELGRDCARLRSSLLSLGNPLVTERLGNDKAAQKRMEALTMVRPGSSS